MSVAGKRGEFDMVRYAKSEATRERLVRSTASLLRTQGYAATALRDIVEASGVPKGSLYHHFSGGKEELAAEAVRRSGQAILQRLQAIAERSKDPAAGVAAFCDYYVAQLRDSGFRRGCPLATVALEAAPNVDAVQQACAEAFAGIERFFAGELRRHGVGRAAAASAASFTVSAVEGALVLAKAKRDTGPLKVVRHQLCGQLRSLYETA